MENPVDEPLQIILKVKAKVAKNWYDAKWKMGIKDKKANKL